MKRTIQIDDQKTVECEWTFWFGRVKLFYNGQETLKLDKTLFKYEDKEFLLKDNFITGKNLYYKGYQYNILEKLIWYEIAISIISFIFVVVFGNIP